MYKINLNSITYSLFYNSNIGLILIKAMKKVINKYIVVFCYINWR